MCELKTNIIPPIIKSDLKLCAMETLQLNKQKLPELVKEERHDKEKVGISHMTKIISLFF